MGVARGDQSSPASQGLANRLGASSERVSALIGLWLFRTGRAEVAEAAEITNELFEIAHELDDPELLLQHIMRPGRT